MANSKVQIPKSSVDRSLICPVALGLTQNLDGVETEKILGNLLAQTGTENKRRPNLANIKP
jgi:hypothetical protein